MGGRAQEGRREEDLRRDEDDEVLQEGERGQVDKDEVEERGEEQQRRHLDRQGAAARRAWDGVLSDARQRPYQVQLGDSPDQDRSEEPPPLDLGFRAPRVGAHATRPRRHHIQCQRTVKKEHDDAIVEHAQHVDRVEPPGDAEQRHGIRRDLQAAGGSRSVRGLLSSDRQSLSVYLEAAKAGRTRGFRR